MSMKVTNRQLIDSVAALNQLSELSLPIKLAYKVAKVSKQVQPYLESYNEVLGKLQQKHVKRDEEGNPVHLDTDEPGVRRLVFADPEAFNKEYEELLELENSITVDKVSADEFGEIDVKPTLLFQLAWLLDGLD